VPDGFLLVDKAAGWTSHDVVARVRRLAGMRKVGHAGTLDPMATGLLVLGLGRATRLLRFVQEAPKTYLASARFGIATDTLDADGVEVERQAMAVTRDEVVATAARFVGEIDQVPPMVSAVKVGGRRLYELARTGETVERRARRVVVHEIAIVDFEAGDGFPEVAMRVRCGSGTYVRTLADDIAAELGGRAHLIGLRRTRIGIHSVADAIDLESDSAAAGLPTGSVVAPGAGLADLPGVILEGDAERAVRHGASVPGGGPDGLVRMLDREGNLLAVYRVAGGKATPEVVLA
jgi:tRNA pseudouridine55 synthase